MPTDHVLGLIAAIALRIVGNSRYIQTKISRPMFRSRSRDRAFRLSTIS